MAVLRSIAPRHRSSLASPAEIAVSYDIAPGPLTRRDAGEVLLHCARTEIAAGLLATACAALRRALIANPDLLAARIELADCLCDRRRFVEASRVLETAYLLARNRGDRSGAAACLHRLVSLNLRDGRIGEARQLLQPLIRAELDARGALSTMTLVNLSRAMRGTWSLPRRWRLLRGALRIAKGSERINVLGHAGRLLLAGHDDDRALRAFDDARRLAERMKSPPARMAAVMSDQGLALVRAGRYAVAVGVLRAAAQLHAGVGNRRWAWKLAALSQRVLNAQRRVDEIAERN
jgi:tetratricopeptide (TPR) repeat protein